VFVFLIINVLIFLIGWLFLELNIRPIGSSVLGMIGLLLFVYLSRRLVVCLIDCFVDGLVDWLFSRLLCCSVDHFLGLYVCCLVVCVLASSLSFCRI
jgi:hypothetical protein